MTPEHHKKRHEELHKAFDELFADYITHHPNQQGFISMPVLQLMAWSAKMAEAPDHEEQPEPDKKTGRGLLR